MSRRFQFSLRGLLVAMLAMCCFFRTTACGDDGSAGAQSKGNAHEENGDVTARASSFSASVGSTVRGRTTAGREVPLQITIRNTTTKPLWIDLNSLPWNWHGSLKAEMNSVFVEAATPIADPALGKLKQLMPGEAVTGSIDLDAWLYIVRHPKQPESVRVRVAMYFLYFDTDHPKTRADVHSDTISLGEFDITVLPTANKGRVNYNKGCPCKRTGRRVARP
jgi:hypothetical protein